MRTKLVIGILVGASLSGCDAVTAISNGVGTPTRDVELLGECRDVTTNKGDSQTEAITFN
jgi:hypothetical protein